MITVWAMLGSAFYFALMFDLGKRVGDDVDVHGLVAMVGTTQIRSPSLSAWHGSVSRARSQGVHFSRPSWSQPGNVGVR
jgi:hypothetical protein